MGAGARSSSIALFRSAFAIAPLRCQSLIYLTQNSFKFPATLLGLDGEFSQSSGYQRYAHRRWLMHQLQKACATFDAKMAFLVAFGTKRFARNIYFQEKESMADCGVTRHDLFVKAAFSLQLSAHPESIA
jgi:hypothetical protein